jgi:hypothetical protein
MIFGSLLFSTLLWPATMKLGSIAATSFRLAIHRARSHALVSAVIMCTLL